MNDRGKVVEGIKHLKPVFELVGWASEDTRTSANSTLSDLKKLVGAEEWEDLLARAGFDPNPEVNTGPEERSVPATQGGPS